MAKAAKRLAATTDRPQKALTARDIEALLAAARDRGCAMPPSALNDLGVFLAESGRLDDALLCYDRALDRRPHDALAHHNRGLALQALGRSEAAIAAQQHAIAIDDAMTDAHHALAVALAKTGRNAEAVECYRRALAREPEHLGAQINLGALLREQDRLDEAAALQRRAVALQPHHAEALNQLGLTLRERNDTAGAADCFARALRAEPQHVSAAVNLAMTWFAEGKIAEAAALYERRWQGYRGKHLPNIKAPLWDGSPLGAGTLLLWSEQGLGDTVQFIRYAKGLRTRVGRIVLACPPPLIPLLQTAPGIDRVVSAAEPPPPAAAHLPLMSAMHRLGTTLGTIPAEIPYLAADPTRMAALAPLLAGEGLRVGLAWAGNPSHANDRRRSLPAQLLRPLIEVPRVRFFSLQVGPRAVDLADPVLAGRVADLSPHLHDFADTAAAVVQLDLVVSIDSAVAHLTGALGRNVRLLLPFSADWRWLLERSDTPWYPTARLLRQPAPGAWAPVIDELVAELRGLA